MITLLPFSPTLIYSSAAAAAANLVNLIHVFSVLFQAPFWWVLLFAVICFDLNVLSSLSPRGELTVPNQRSSFTSLPACEMLNWLPPLRLLFFFERREKSENEKMVCSPSLSVRVCWWLSGSINEQCLFHSFTLDYIYWPVLLSLSADQQQQRQQPKQQQQHQFNSIAISPAQPPVNCHPSVFFCRSLVALQNLLPQLSPLEDSLCRPVLASWLTCCLSKFAPITSSFLNCTAANAFLFFFVSFSSSFFLLLFSPKSEFYTSTLV